MKVRNIKNKKKYENLKKMDFVNRYDHSFTREMRNYSFLNW